eukprot:759853-Hanusia_phi.AAC.1
MINYIRRPAAESDVTSLLRGGPVSLLQMMIPVTVPGNQKLPVDGPAVIRGPPATLETADGNGYPRGWGDLGPARLRRHVLLKCFKGSPPGSWRYRLPRTPVKVITNKEKREASPTPPAAPVTSAYLG